MYSTSYVPNQMFILLADAVLEAVKRIPETRIPSPKALLWAVEKLIDWPKVAKSLDLTEAEIEVIKHNDQGDYREQRYQMLRKWHTKEGKLATGRRLAYAFSKQPQNAALVTETGTVYL